MASSLPKRCIPEDEWPGILWVDYARLSSQTEAPEEAATAREKLRQKAEGHRLDREDYLEAYCASINTYRRKQRLTND